MSEVIIVEDDDSIRELISYALTSSGFNVKSMDSADKLYDELNKEIPSLIILDIMLPGEDGISILKKINSDYKKIPVIIVSAKGNEMDKIKALDTGADDYITKPFSVLELVSRVKAVLRRCEKDKNDIIKIKDITIDLNRRKVLVGDEDIILTYKEFELLIFLANNKGYVLSRDKIVETIWGFEFSGESRTVDMHIKTLRKKLKDSGSIIKTIRNVGYKIEV